MAMYEAEPMLSSEDEEKESTIFRAVSAFKSFWKDILNSGNRDRHLVVLTSWSN